MLFNENGPEDREPTQQLPDAHGNAALLLVESLIHGLCEKQALSAVEAIEIAERAVDVQDDKARSAGGAAPTMWHSHALLTAISASLRSDLEH